MSALFGETLTFPQENGPEVELVVFGDEFYARRETIDGFSVIYDDLQGHYCYATLQDGHFVSSGVPLSDSPPGDLQPHLQESEEVQRQKFATRYTELRPSASDGSTSASSNIS